MKDQIEEFRAYRAKMNERILAADNKVIKRIYNIDTNTYMEGALSSKVKEMLGLGRRGGGDYRYPSFEKSCRILGAVAGSNRPGGRKRKIKHEV